MNKETQDAYLKWIHRYLFCKSGWIYHGGGMYTPSRPNNPKDWIVSEETIQELKKLNYEDHGNVSF